MLSKTLKTRYSELASEASNHGNDDQVVPASPKAASSTQQVIINEVGYRGTPAGSMNGVIVPNRGMV